MYAFDEAPLSIEDVPLAIDTSDTPYVDGKLLDLAANAVHDLDTLENLISELDAAAEGLEMMRDRLQEIYDAVRDEA